MELITELKDLGFLGAALTVMAASISLYVKSSRENQRVYRKVLYYLLEIWHASRIIRFSASFSAESMMDILREETAIIMSEADTDEESVTIPEKLLEALAQQMQAQVAEGALQHGYTSLENLSSEYTNAIQHLTEINPRLAFRLSSRSNYGAYVDQLRDNLTEVRSISSTHHPDADAIMEPSFQDKLESEMDIALKDLEADISITSRAISMNFGLRMYVWMWRQKQNEAFTQPDRAGIRETLSELIPAIEEQVQKEKHKKASRPVDTEAPVL